MSICLTDFRILRAQRILGTSMSKRPIKAARLDLYRYTHPHPTGTADLDNAAIPVRPNVHI